MRKDLVQPALAALAAALAAADGRRLRLWSWCTGNHRELGYTTHQGLYSAVRLQTGRRGALSIRIEGAWAALGDAPVPPRDIDDAVSKAGRFRPYRIPQQRSSPLGATSPPPPVRLSDAYVAALAERLEGRRAGGSLDPSDIGCLAGLLRELLGLRGRHGTGGRIRRESPSLNSTLGSFGEA